MTQEQGNQPVKEFRVSGGISAAIWINRTQRDGRDITCYSVRIQKRYKDKNDEWKNTDYFFPEDLPKLALVATKAFDFVSSKTNEANGDPSTVSE